MRQINEVVWLALGYLKALNLLISPATEQIVYRLLQRIQLRLNKQVKIKRTERKSMSVFILKVNQTKLK